MLQTGQTEVNVEIEDFQEVEGCELVLDPAWPEKEKLDRHEDLAAKSLCGQDSGFQNPSIRKRSASD